MGRKSGFYTDRQRKKFWAMQNNGLSSMNFPEGTIESEAIPASRFVRTQFDNDTSFAEDQKAEFEAHMPEIIKMSLLGASILTGNPVFFLLLKAITAIEFAIKAAKELERRRFVTRFETAIKTGTNIGIQVALGNMLESFAGEITEISSQYGITGEIAKQTNYDEDYVKVVYQRTARSLLDDGVKRLANMVYDIV